MLVNRTENGSGFRQKLVFINHGSHGNFAVRRAIIDAHDFALTAHSDALRLSDFGRQSERELDGRTRRDGCIDKKANTASTHIARLSGF